MWRTAGKYLFIGRDSTAGEDFSTRFISSLFISSVCTHCQRLCVSCYMEEHRAEGKAAGHCHEACLAEKGNTYILQVFRAEAELAGAEQMGVQSPWSPGCRAALLWCDSPAALPGHPQLPSSPGLAVFLSLFLEGVTKVEQRLMEQKAELTSMCFSAAAPKIWLRNGLSLSTEL